VAYNIVTLGVAQLTPIAGGYISQKYGWRTQFYILIAFSSIALLLITFACPEHGNYKRAAIYETDTGREQLLESSNEKSTSAAQVRSTQEEVANVNTTDKPRSYIQELNPFSGFDRHQNPLILAARPFVCMLYPAVFWGFTVGGLWSAWVSQSYRNTD
jgi:MFS family permease